MYIFFIVMIKDSIKSAKNWINLKGRTNLSLLLSSNMFITKFSHIACCSGWDGQSETITYSVGSRAWWNWLQKPLTTHEPDWAFMGKSEMPPSLHHFLPQTSRLIASRLFGLSSLWSVLLWRERFEPKQSGNKATHTMTTPQCTTTATPSCFGHTCWRTQTHT